MSCFMSGWVASNENQISNKISYRVFEIELKYSHIKDGMTSSMNVDSNYSKGMGNVN